MSKPRKWLIKRGAAYPPFAWEGPDVEDGEEVWVMEITPSPEQTGNPHQGVSESDLSDQAIGDEEESADLHLQWAADGDDLERSFGKLHAYAKGLESDNKQLEDALTDAARMIKEEVFARTKAESHLSTLRAKVESLEAELKATKDRMWEAGKAADAAESQLSTLRAQGEGQATAAVSRPGTYTDRMVTDAPASQPQPVDLTKEIQAVRSYIARSAPHYLESNRKGREEHHEMAQWGISRIQHHLRTPPTPSGEPQGGDTSTEKGGAA